MVNLMGINRVPHRFSGFWVGVAFFVICLLSMVGFSSVNAAEPPALKSRLEIVSDGTPNFDSTTYGPGADGQYGSTNTSDPLIDDNTDNGTDSSSSNLIVRASDDIIYRGQISINGSDANPVAIPRSGLAVDSRRLRPKQ